MDRLIQAIEAIRPKIDSLRKHALKETPTRTIVIDPLLEALGWDVRDPDEVQLEYPTVDGKSVDYGLTLNRKCVLLVEAKPLDDPLNDVKAITQVVGYATNDGIVWCILTNGLRWKVYSSMENCPAPEKLMYEVSLDPRDSQGISVREIAAKMWRFSREQTARGALDDEGERVFTDGKVRKALDSIMLDPPRAFLNIIRTAIGDKAIDPKQIKASLPRVWGKPEVPSEPAMIERQARPGPKTRQRVSRPFYDEPHHVAGKPKEVIEMYRAVDRFCLSLGPGHIAKSYKAKYIVYARGKHSFCNVHIQQGGLRVWLRLKYSRLTAPPAFARDVSNVGHWGTGDLELGINNFGQLEEAKGLIRQSFDETTP